MLNVFAMSLFAIHIFSWVKHLFKHFAHVEQLIYLSPSILIIYSHIFLHILVTISLSDTCVYKYFIPFCGLPFNILTFILKSEHFKFDTIYQFLMVSAFGALCPNLIKISSVPFIFRFIIYLR